MPLHAPANAALRASAATELLSAHPAGAYFLDNFRLITGTR
jgi:hypothetical protein